MRAIVVDHAAIEARREAIRVAGEVICERCSRPMNEHGAYTPNRCTNRDLSDLTPQLTGLEGARVEVVDDWPDATPRRFYVSRSTGWRPCHIEVARRDSTGGIGASRTYKSVRVIRTNAR